MTNNEFLPEEVQKRLPPLYSQEDNLDPIVQVRFFCPANGWEWFATEYSPKDGIFFGLVKGWETEWGTWWREELESSGHVFRDTDWKPVPMSTVKKRINY